MSVSSAILKVQTFKSIIIVSSRCGHTHLSIIDYLTLLAKCTTLKVWRDFPDGSHNDTCAESGYFEYIEGFIREVVLRGKKDFREGSKEGPPPAELEKL